MSLALAAISVFFSASLPLAVCFDSNKCAILTLFSVYAGELLSMVAELCHGFEIKEFTDVAKVANAARNIEIFRDRPKNEGVKRGQRDMEQGTDMDLTDALCDRYMTAREDMGAYGCILVSLPLAVCFDSNKCAILTLFSVYAGELLSMVAELCHGLSVLKVEAENWIAHIEKIFEVLGCDDQFKARLATYKLEGDAHSWWRAYKQAKGGDAYVATLSWNDFRDIFFLQYFPYSEKERCEREYKSIRQLPEETSTDFMKRFLRLAGFLGAKAGTQEEQAKHFKWGLNDFVLDRILNTEFTDVAQVANAARNIEIFRDRPKNEGDNKRDRDGHRIRPSKTPSQGSNMRANDRRDSDKYGNHGRHGNRDRYGTDRWHGDRQGSDRHGNGSDRQGNGSQKAWRDQDQQVRGQHYSRSYRSSSQSGYSDYNSCPPCNLCGKFHPGKACHRATGACFECGEVGHLAKDCKKGSTSSEGK
ncbi:zinc finger, CCHC-type, retrotransposon gag domain protein [Tanacetum coccineum]